MPLFDPYGRPIDKIPQKPDLDMVGTMRIRDRWSGYPSVKLTPEKLASVVKKQEAALQKRYGVSKVSFRVVVEDGKAKLKASPVRNTG